MRWNFSDSYSKLPPEFARAWKAQRVTDPRLVVFNQALASSLGLGDCTDDDFAFLAGNQPPDGTSGLALAYAGHQYGHLTMLGDGRALLLGEHRDPAGRRFDVQLKGSGRTPFSRGGDGKAALGPMLREYLVSEAMAALGVPTTRSLAVVATGDGIWRDELQRGAVLTRVASSHLRVGSFEYAAGSGVSGATEALLDYAIARHYPQLADAPDRPRAFLDAVVGAQAELAAQWMGLGFVHGVLNTDNVAISGETIDYGPCAFLDTYHPATVFSSIDRHGRYAFGNQPRITHWNLARLAEALGLDEQATDSFPKRYEQALFEVIGPKVGIAQLRADDWEIVQGLLDSMQTLELDFTNTFRSLAHPGSAEHIALKNESWYPAWRARLVEVWGAADRPEAGTLMDAHNPVYIPRNHLVEETLAAAESSDLEPFHGLLKVLVRPYSEQTGQERYAQPAPKSDARYVTYCGT